MADPGHPSQPVSPPPPPPAPPGATPRTAAPASVGHAARPASGGGRASSGELPVAVRDALADPARRLGRYVILAELGRGGMGVVFRGYDPELRRDVAIKMMRDAALASAPERERFGREARAAAGLRHPGIVSVHEVGEHEGRPFLVMDYVAGETLEARRERGRIEPRAVAEIGRELALALDHAHRQGIVHRDVKPQNVLLDAAGRPHLVDFGLARSIDGDSKITLSGQLVGTPQYVAPEQARGGGKPPGPLADVYGLGAVLYAALTGRPPFDGATMLEVLRQVFSADPVAPRAIDPTVHADLETIALRCLEKTPERRYRGAREVAEELARFVAGEAILARPIGRLRRVGRWARRNRLLAAAIVALGAVLLASAAVAVVAVRAERAARIERAVSQERAAWDAFERARRARPPEGESAEKARRRLDRALALGLDAVQAAATRHALAPDDPRARRAAFDATVAYGEVALAAEQWSVAASAFEKALALGVDDARARASLSGVEVARRRLDEAHRVAVEAILADARAGRLAERGAYEDALFELVRYPEEQTVRLLATEIEEVTRDMQQALLALARSAATPTPEEAARGAEPIAGIEDAYRAYWARPPDGFVARATAQAIQASNRRVASRRVRRAGGEGLPRGTGVRDVKAGALDRAIGEARLLAAQLCCEALGRIGIREGAVEPLGRYLRVEADELRAVRAGLALCQLGGDAAERWVREAIREIGTTGPFHQQVSRFIGQVELDTTLAERSARGYFEQGLAFMRRGELDAADEAFSRSIELDPTDADAFVNRGVVRSDLGRLSAAIDDFTRATEAAPGNGTAWSNLGTARRAAGDPPGALAALDRALEVEPGLAGAWSIRGSVHAQMGQPQKALADISRALELDPQQAQAWCNRGGVKLMLRDLDGAFEDFSAAIELDPRLVEAWINRGTVRRVRGDLDGAIADFTRATELVPDAAHAFYLRALARSLKGDLERARRDLDRALEIDPRHAKALARRGRLACEASDWVAAEPDLRAAVALAPGDAMAWQDLAVALANLGRLAEGLEAVTRAVEAAPGDVRGWTTRGQLHLDLGQAAEAEQSLSRAIDLDGRHPPPWALRGRARERLGRLAAARGDYERFLELVPRGPEAERARARLAELDAAGGGEGR